MMPPPTTALSSAEAELLELEHKIAETEDYQGKISDFNSEATLPVVPIL